MSLSLKEGVSLKGVQPEAVVGLLVLYTLWEKMWGTREFVVTSCTDGQHMVGSLHYKGRAWDLRSNNLLPAEQVKYAEAAKVELGKEWDFITEGDHFHAEFDPK